MEPAKQDPAAPHRVSAETLNRFVHDVALRCGLPAGHADLFTEALMAADLRGIPSHGLFRLGIYSRGFLSGNVNPAPSISESGGASATRLMDGDNGLGLVVGQLAMDRAVELAHENGIGMVSVHNSNHSGVLAVHVLRAAREGMVGFFTSNAPALMAPWGAQEAVLSNSPFAYAFPAREGPIVVDMACSAVARGRIRLAALDGRPIPLGWALDADGNATDDPLAAMEGVVLPMGEYKGSGLAIAHEILAACVSGAMLSMNVPRVFLKHGADTLDAWDVGHLAIAIDIQTLRSRHAFESDVAELTNAVRGATPQLGVEEVVMPGDREAASVRRLLHEGVPVPLDTARALCGLGRELSVAVPEELRAIERDS